MRRRRKRTRIKAAPVLWLLLIANVAAGIAYSPITSIRKIRVDGAKEDDQARIRNFLAKLQGVPAVQAWPMKVETAALSSSEVRSADFSRNLFGSGLLKIRYRRPVAAIAGRPDLVLTIDGVLYRTESSSDGLVQVRLPRGAGQPILALAGPWEPAGLASLAVKLRQTWPEKKIVIQFDPRGALFFQVEGVEVVLGSLKDLDQKLTVMRKSLQEDPNLFSSVKKLILTAPSNPSVVRIKR